MIKIRIVMMMLFLLIIISCSEKYKWSCQEEYCKEQQIDSADPCERVRCLYESSSGRTEDLKQDTFIAYLNCQIENRQTIPLDCSSKNEIKVIPNE